MIILQKAEFGLQSDISNSPSFASLGGGATEVTNILLISGLPSAVCYVLKG